MTKLKRVLPIILILFSYVHSYGQTDTTAGHNLDLTEHTIKKIFSLKPVNSHAVEWTACYQTDSTYITADTIKLYSDKYYYLTTHCCYVTSWEFTNSTTFSLSETKVCQEPPRTSIYSDDCGLNIKFRTIDNKLIMSIYKQKKLKDTFHIVALNYIELKRDQYAYVLTMVRK